MPLEIILNSIFAFICGGIFVQEFSKFRKLWRENREWRKQVREHEQVLKIVNDALEGKISWDECNKLTAQLTGEPVAHVTVSTASPDFVPPENAEPITTAGSVDLPTADEIVARRELMNEDIIIH